MSGKSANPNVGNTEEQELLAMAGEGLVIVGPNETDLEFKDANDNPYSFGVFINYGTDDATIVSATQKVINPSRKPLVAFAGIIIPAGGVRIVKLTDVKITTGAGGDLWMYYA